MRNTDTSREQVIEEVEALRQRIAELETSETERKRAEEALRESEEKFRSIVEQSVDGITLTDEQGNIIGWNRGEEQITGLKRDEVVGRPFWDVMFQMIPEEHRSPATFEEIKAQFFEFFRTGRAPWVNQLQQGTIQLLDGTRRDIEEVVFPIRTGKGLLLGALSRDVTERKRMEERLRLNERELELLLESLPEILFYKDTNDRLVRCNRNFTLALHTSLEEVLGKTTDDLYPQQAEDMKRDDREVIETGQPKTGIIEPYDTPDGRRWAQTSKVPILDESGQVVGLLGVATDITETMRMEETLRESERAYKTLFDTALEGVAIIDGQTLRVVLCNQNAARIFGFHSPEEAIGLDPLTVVHPDDVDRAAKIMLQDGFGEDLHEVNEFRLIAKDGRELWVSAVGAITEYQGSPAMMVSFREITERKQAEDALRQSEERYRTVLEEMEDSYFEVDLGGHITFANDSTCQTLCILREKLMGESYKAFSAEKDIEVVYKTFNKVYRTGKPVKSVSWEVVRGDGSVGFAEAVILPLRNKEGEIIGFRGIGRDVTERKQVEEEKRDLEQKAHLASRLASVGEMASGIAHEINNPLTGVIGYAQLLMGRDLPEDIRSDVKTIHEGGQRVASIVKRLLTFARQYKPHRDYVIINDIIAITLNLRAYELETSSIKTNLQLDPDLPVTIADAGQLQQVFLNLIINAETEMKSAHGRGKLSIKTEAIDNTIRISFRDDGPGIAKENLDKIFDPFFTTREVGQGTGLGLSVCHGIIVEHGGRIYVESKLGKGATFIVELPILTKPEQLELPEPAVEEPQRITKAKILVVDDEPTVLQFLSQLLTDEGHEVETVDNADDALKMVESKRYSLILLDIKMPGMSGMELYKRIRGVAKSLAGRVVFITGDVIGAETTAFLSQTKARYITKPFDAEQLKKDINRILTESKS